MVYSMEGFVQLENLELDNGAFCGSFGGFVRVVYFIEVLFS